MRIVSQNGDMDFQYENTRLMLGSGNNANMIIAKCDDTTVTFAIYENKEKAIEVMKQCRNAYIGANYPLFTNIEIDAETMEHMNFNNALLVSAKGIEPSVSVINQNVVFQFPKDSEVEE